VLLFHIFKEQPRAEEASEIKVLCSLCHCQY